MVANTDAIKGLKMTKQATINTKAFTMSDLKDLIAEARTDSRKEIDRSWKHVVSRGCWVAASKGDHALDEAYNNTFKNKGEFVALVNDLLAQGYDSITIDGGFDGAENMYEFTQFNYEPWVGEWSIDIVVDGEFTEFFGGAAPVEPEQAVSEEEEEEEVEAPAAEETYFGRKHAQVDAIYKEVKAANGKPYDRKLRKHLVELAEKLDIYAGDSDRMVDIDDNGDELVIDTTRLLAAIAKELMAAAFMADKHPKLLSVESKHDILDGIEDVDSWTVWFEVATNSLEEAKQVIADAGFNVKAYGTGLNYDCSGQTICYGVFQTSVTHDTERGVIKLGVSYGYDV